MRSSRDRQARRHLGRAHCRREPLPCPAL